MANNFTCQIPHSNGNAIIIDVIIAFCLQFEDSAKEISVKVKGLVDTGASGSCISQRLVSACRLEKLSALKIISAQGASIVPVYEVDMILPNNTRFNRMSVMEVATSGKFDVIIGMDILSKCDFAVSNSGENLTFTMRFPTAKTPIDFTKQGEN